MAPKTATVSVRIQPDIKQQAEEVLERLGIPVSVLIDSLYRQIIMTNSIPYTFSVPQTLDTMTTAQFDAMMAEGLKQVQERKGFELDEAFERIREGIL